MQRPHNERAAHSKTTSDAKQSHQPRSDESGPAPTANKRLAVPVCELSPFNADVGKTASCKKRKRGGTSAYLGHFVRFALPGESFVVERIVLGADVDGLPALVRLVALGDVEDVQALRDVHRPPLDRLGQRVAVVAHALVERQRHAAGQLLQLHFHFRSIRFKILATMATIR